MSPRQRIPTARRFKRFPAKTARLNFKILFSPRSSIPGAPSSGLLFLVVLFVSEIFTQFLPGSSRSPPPGDSNGFQPKPLGRFSKLFFSPNPRSLLHHTTVSFFSSFFLFRRYLHGFLPGCKFSIRALRGLCPVFLKALFTLFSCSLQKISKLLPQATLQFERRLFKSVSLSTQRFYCVFGIFG